jgi:hypothetical protein
MRVRTIATFQGHYVPSKAYRAQGIFAPEVTRREPTLVDYDTEQEGLSSFPHGATAQNGMRGVRYFKCNVCETVIVEHELDDHVCPEPADG